MSTFAGSVPWFPQEYAEQFYLIKGSIALVAVVLLIVHMSLTWPTIARWGQRLRYFALLSAAVLLAGSTAEQVQQGALVSYRNLGAVFVSVLILVAASVSLRDDLSRK